MDVQSQEIIEYKKLNDSVNKVFFSGRFQDASVYLDLEDDLRIKLAELLRCDVGNLDKAIGLSVEKTLNWDASNIYTNHYRCLKDWQALCDGSPPPFSALLLAFSVSAERMRQDENYSSANYYQRLCEVLESTDEFKKNKLSQCGKHTHIFWRSLNRWLLDHDYAYGRPTAKQVNKMKYVSLAISQSLVRDADRKHFHQLFSKFFLSPDENIGAFEMKLYLDEWMASSAPSPWLKKLWSNDNLKERVVSAAVHELEDWDGGVLCVITPGNVSKKMNWVAVESGFPRPSLSLYLSTGAGTSVDGVRLDLKENSSQLACKALGGGSNIWLSPLAGTDIDYLSPLQELNIEAMLLASFELGCNIDSATYKHNPRPIIPLVKSDTASYYREISRVSLHIPHLILCHSNWKSQVQFHLEKYARPGFSCLDSSVKGIPPDWVVFKGVEVLGVSDEEVNDNMQSLVPLSEGACIHFDGGLKLATGIWHSSSPPDILASDDDGLMALSVKSNEMEGREEELYSQNDEEFNPSFLSAVNLSLNYRNITICASKGGKVKAEKDIAFRSAMTPRRVDERSSIYSYSLVNGKGYGWGVSAELVGRLPNGRRLCGMQLIGVEAELPEKIDSDVFIGLSNVSSDQLEDDKTYDVSHVSGFSESCILRGYHYWICDSYTNQGSGKNNRHMECKDCRLSMVCKKLKKKKSQLAEHAISGGSNEAFSNIKIREERKISFDVVYDAICYIGSGNWRSLETAISPAVDQPWDAVIVSRNLIDLGLIDAKLDDRGSRPSAWSCPSPTLVLGGNGRLFLSGYRNEELIQRVSEALSGITISSSIQSQKLAPKAYLWEVGDAELRDILECIDGIIDPLGRHVQLTHSPGISIAKFMPTPKKILKTAKAISIDNKEDISRFDLYSGRWKRGDLKKTGAYKTFFAGTRYFYRDNSGRLNETSFEFAKILSARDELVRLHGFDIERQQFECVLGCQPYGLFKRALVSCSGLLPTIVQGKQVYENISPELASVVLKKLYS